MDNTALFNLSYGVYVITTWGEGKATGCTANSAMQITAKLAQQTNAEMHGADDISMIYPLEQLKYRKRFIDDLNKYYGEKYSFNASVEFGELLKNNYDRVINYVPDELNEKGIVADKVDVENNVDNVESEVETDETTNKQNDE